MMVLSKFTQFTSRASSAKTPPSRDWVLAVAHTLTATVVQCVVKDYVLYLILECYRILELQVDD